MNKRFIRIERGSYSFHKNDRWANRFGGFIKSIYLKIRRSGKDNKLVGGSIQSKDSLFLNKETENGDEEKKIYIEDIDSYKNIKFLKFVAKVLFLLSILILHLIIILFLSLSNNIVQDEHHIILLDVVKYAFIFSSLVLFAYLILNTALKYSNIKLENDAISKQLEKRSFEDVISSALSKKSNGKEVIHDRSKTASDDMKSRRSSSEIIENSDLHVTKEYDIQRFDAYYNDFICIVEEYSFILVREVITGNENVLREMAKKSDFLYKQLCRIVEKNWVKSQLSKDDLKVLKDWHNGLIEKSKPGNMSKNFKDKKAAELDLKNDIVTNYNITKELHKILDQILHEYTKYDSVFELISAELFKGFRNNKKEKENHIEYF